MTERKDIGASPLMYRFYWPIVQGTLGLRPFHFLSVKEFAQIRSGDQVLELGAGYPFWRVYSQQVGASGQFVSLDADHFIQKSSSRICATLNKYTQSSKPERFLTADNCRLPFADNSFDFVLASNVINDERFVIESYRVLRPLGHFIHAWIENNNPVVTREVKDACKLTGFTKIRKVKGAHASLVDPFYNWLLFAQKPA